MSSSSSSSQPINLVSVNTAPDRAKKVIGEVIDNVKDKYSIVHAGNTTSEPSLPLLVLLGGYVKHIVLRADLVLRIVAIEGIKPLLLSVQPPPGILVRHKTGSNT